MRLDQRKHDKPEDRLSEREQQLIAAILDGEKPEGVNGAAAPQMWLDGRYQEVLDYCAGDVRLTMALALEAKRLGAVRWTSRAGRSTGARMLELLTVQEALLLPEPDVSWQTGERWTREKFTGWINK